MHAWSARHVPAQGGKVAVVTGANSGLGWQLAETLAAKGATVVMGCRARAWAADAIRRLHPDARVEVDARSTPISRRSRASRPMWPNAMGASISSATTPA